MYDNMVDVSFEWDKRKNDLNIEKHGVSFDVAQEAFYDPRRIISEDQSHSQIEPRYYCFGLVEGAVLTVRFTYRRQVIRIIGAGYWRQGKRFYEQENKL